MALKKSVNWKLACWIVVLIVLSPASLLIVRQCVKASLESRIRDKIAAIRKAGEPVTAQDIARLSPPP